MSLKKEVSFYWVWMVIALGLLVVSLYAFVGDFRRLHQNGVINYSEFHHWRLWPRPSPMPPRPLTIDEIRAWMTFDYLNAQFKLPNDYLKTKLDITSRAYPRLTLREAAGDARVPESAVINATQNAIREYAPPKP